MSTDNEIVVDPSDSSDSSDSKKPFDFADILSGMNSILQPVGAEVQMKRKNEKTGAAEECNQEEAVNITNFRIQSAAAQHAMKGMSYADRREWLVEKKEEGNVCFQEKDYEKACEMYLQAISALTMGETEEEKHDSVTNIQVPLVNNLAACYAELGKFHKVAGLCDQVLRLDPDNLKGTLRMGHALLALREHKEAKVKLERAIELSKGADVGGSGDRIARKAKKLLHHLNRSVNKDRKTVKKMMGKGLGEMYVDKKKEISSSSSSSSSSMDNEQSSQSKAQNRSSGGGGGGGSGGAANEVAKDESDVSSVDSEGEDGEYEGTFVGHFGSVGPASSLRECGDTVWQACVKRCCSCFKEKRSSQMKKEEMRRFMKKDL